MSTSPSRRPARCIAESGPPGQSARTMTSRVEARHGTRHLPDPWYRQAGRSLRACLGRGLTLPPGGSRGTSGEGGLENRSCTAREDFMVRPDAPYALQERSSWCVQTRPTPTDARLASGTRPEYRDSETSSMPTATEGIVPGGNVGTTETDRINT